MKNAVHQLTQSEKKWTKIIEEEIFNVKLKKNEIMTKCPKCNNSTEFKIKATANNCKAIIWIVCICGFSPYSELGENKWLHEMQCATLSKSIVPLALDSWNEILESMGVIE